MNKLWTSLILTLNLLLILGFVNFQVFGKQKIIAEGTTVFLKLAPVDPRSLMQGDYMILRQEIDSEINKADSQATPTRGTVILQLADNAIGKFARFESSDRESLADDEVRIRYRRSNRGYLFGMESFFFQEGEAEKYEDAKFCEIKVNQDGDVVLVELRGANLVEL